jgi:hypothetical protein
MATLNEVPKKNKIIRMQKHLTTLRSQTVTKGGCINRAVCSKKNGNKNNKDQEGGDLT